jgi:glycosyltransferase involved in cell wall biosynthesis
MTGLPYSFTAHGGDLHVDQTFLARKLADASFVVTISRYNASLLAAYGNQEHHYVVHCGVDPTAYRFRPRRPPPTGPVRMLCVATMQESKGHRVLLEALARGDGELERVQVEFVGEGELRRQLERIVKRSPVLLRRVRFLGGLPEPQVAAALDRAEVFVLPSLIARSGRMEGVPVALMEALAAGVPVIATRLPGVTELIADGKTGMLAEPGDVASLQATLRRVISRSANLDLEAGRRRIETEFNVNISARRLGELFRHYSW